MYAYVPPEVAQAAPSSDQPDVIEVVGTRADQALKIDRRTYEVKQTPHSQQKDAIQLLRGLPAVTISPDDTISLLGGSGVRIFVDGRPYQGDATQYLRSLHGTDIERIEIITNPSAQYSAEGTAGIINFVLRKKQGEGVSGTAIAELSSFGHGFVDASVKAKHGKWTYELRAGGRAGTNRRSSYSKLRSVEQVPGGMPTINSESGGGPSRGTEGEADAKISYEVDRRTSLSAYILGATARDSSTNNAELVGLTPGFQSFSQHERFGTSLSLLIAQLNFDHKGKRSGETLNASLRLFDGPQHESNKADFSNDSAFSVDKFKRFLTLNGQVDWQHPMGKGEILSLGGTWDYSWMSERYLFSSIGTGGSLGSNAADQFRGVDNKAAGYVTFQQPIGGWTLMPGLRVERDSRHITSPGHPDVHISRTDVFPTLHIDHALSKSLDLTLSYSKRIQRPDLSDLRPYPLVQDVLTIKQGNPHLQDESTDSYEINLHYHRKKVDAGLIVYDRETSRLWNQDYSVVGGVTVFTFLNAGHSSDRGAEFDVGAPIFPRVKLNASVNLFDERAPTGVGPGSANAETFRYTTNGTLEWDGPDRGGKPGDVAQLQWIYIGPYRQFQIHDFAWNQLNLSYTHSFARTVSLTGTLTYNGPNRHQLDAPLVQEFFRDHSPVQFKIKLLKTFGKP
jgi:hypothetical protein